MELIKKKLLGRQYVNYVKMKIESVLVLTNMFIILALLHQLLSLIISYIEKKVVILVAGEILDNILQDCRIVNGFQKLNKFGGQYETKNYYVSGFDLDGMWFILFTTAKSSLCC